METRVKNLAKVTQIVSGRARNGTQGDCLQRLCINQHSLNVLALKQND